MLGGIAVGLAVSAIWIGTQILLSRVLRTKSYFRAMLSGYLVSLPVVYLVWRSMASAFPAGWTTLVGAEHQAHVLLHAYVVHLLIFFLYAECFYHVERSVTLRLLIEIRDYPYGPPTVDAISENYRVADMIGERLQVLGANNYLEKSGDRFLLSTKGRRFAIGVRLFCWIYQSKTQDQRL